MAKFTHHFDSDLFKGTVEVNTDHDLVDGAGAQPTARRPNVQMPDEYLPPNKILFLQNLPDNVTKDQLMALFSQCVELRLPCGSA